MLLAKIRLRYGSSSTAAKWSLTCSEPLQKSAYLFISAHDLTSIVSRAYIRRASGNKNSRWLHWIGLVYPYFYRSGSLAFENRAKSRHFLSRIILSHNINRPDAKRIGFVDTHLCSYSSRLVTPSSFPPPKLLRQA
jgi:hypothetical protein